MTQAPPPAGPPPGPPSDQPPSQPPTEPPAGPPPEPAVPTPPSGSAGNGKVIAIIVGALVVVAGVVVALVLALGGDDDDAASDGDSGSGGGDDADQVVEVVDTWTTAATQGDCDAAIAVMTEGLVKEAGECNPEAVPEADKYSFDIGEPEIDGDKATVEVIAAFEGEDEAPIDFRLTREGDEWLIEGYGDLGEGADTPEAPESSTSP